MKLPKSYVLKRPRKRIIRSNRYNFPQSLFVKYTFLVLPLHLIIGMLFCYITLIYVASWYFSEEVQVYTRPLYSRVNDVIPMLISMAAVKYTNPVRMRIVFCLSDVIIRVTRKYFDPFFDQFSTSFDFNVGNPVNIYVDTHFFDY